MTTALAIRPQGNITTINQGLWHSIHDYMARGIHQCDTASQIEEIINSAAAWETYWHQSQQYELEDACCKIRLRAFRVLGRFLRQMREDGIRRGRGGDQRSKFGKQTLKTLADLGCDKTMSYHAQKLDEIPDDDFEDYLDLGMSPESMIRHHFKEKPDDPQEEYDADPNMPEFNQEEKKPYVSFKMNIETPEAMLEFSKLIGQTVTERTRYINFPKRTRLEEAA